MAKQRHGASRRKWHKRHEVEIEQRGEETWEIRGIANNTMGEMQENSLTVCLGARPKHDREIKSMNPAPNLKKFKDPDPEHHSFSSHFTRNH